MFSKLKQVKDLRSQAKQMQNALSQESATADKNGVIISMNGNLEVVSVVIPAGLSPEKTGEAVKSATNDAIKKVQRIMAKKMQEMGGFPGLS